jgi:GntR family transcriptional repressor for pyruvate dehydrogenase complex
MARRNSLSIEIAEDLKRKIHDKKLLPGERIQTEAKLCDVYNVSRTVVREAMASLRSQGFVSPRHGVGVFVSETTPAQRFEVDWEAIRTLPQTIALLEMRLAIEVETSGLCAARRSKSEARVIRILMDKTNPQERDPEASNMNYDYDIHLAIAKAAKNVHLFELLKFLKPIIVPRIKLSALVGRESKVQYYRVIQLEHESVVAAIDEKDEPGAREAMRRHLSNSLERVRKLGESSSKWRLERNRKATPSLMREFARDIAANSRS